MSDFYVLFCKCGRVHFIPYSIINRWCISGGESTGRTILHVCRGCGNTLEIGANGNELSMYISAVKEKRIMSIGSSKYFTIIEEGLKIPMRSGNYATSFKSSIFIDDIGLENELHGGGFDRLRNLGLNDSDQLDFKDIDSVNVDMMRLVKIATQSELTTLKSYSIKSFDWDYTQVNRCSTHLTAIARVNNSIIQKGSYYTVKFVKGKHVKIMLQDGNVTVLPKEMFEIMQL